MQQNLTHFFLQMQATQNWTVFQSTLRPQLLLVPKFQTTLKLKTLWYSYTVVEMEGSFINNEILFMEEADIARFLLPVFSKVRKDVISFHFY